MIPHPSPTYIKKQTRFKTLLSSERTADEGDERKRLDKYLETAFAKAFDLSPDRGKVATRFFWRHKERLFDREDNFFDHPSYYRRGDNFVIVGQPYQLDAEAFKQWTRRVGASGTVASQWGFWNPGEAGLVIAEFTPEAKAAADKRLQKERVNL
jgi:hypothetical protein